MKPQLSGSHRRTYGAIFRHPVARNLAWRDVRLDRHHGDVAKRVVGAIVLDETHLTEDQLLARARDCYAGMAPQRTTHPPSAGTGATR